MHRSKAKKKSKTKKSLEANATKDLPSQVAWEGWFRPHQSSSQSPQEMNQPILAQLPTNEDEETQDLTIAANENHDDDTTKRNENKRPRGPNKEIPTPANPNERKLVHILHDEKFVDPKIVRTITKCIQVHFNDAWPTWKKVPEAIKDGMWAKFEGKFMWPIEKTKVVRTIWETTCKERLRGMLEEERKRAMRHFGVSDISKCKGYNVGWIRVDIWDRLVSDVWTSNAWKNRSIIGKQNRMTEKDGSITKHTGGSIPFMVHAERMEKELKRKPTYGELFNRTHKREKGQGDFVDHKSKNVSETYTSSMSQKYGSDEANHPEFDPEVWCDAIGGRETTRTHFYGFGITPRGKNFVSTSINVGDASYSACSRPAHEREQTPFEVDNLREEVTLVKDRIMNLEDKVEKQASDTADIKKYLEQLMEMFNPARMFTNASMGPSQPTS
ncbi:putative transposase Ptta/En/Spm plant protein [Dioscorea alata]|uniref:Transposase Ptta/En/Spm plant protein n=1 Tax=Dioscorea alata TaxID=55571 RepID=A0ACB7VE12_DIOAL|nr:putative transposase Ptta/En/Spm plant protein [Dioscorea alata]